MNETATYNETIIVATLVIATNYFFSLLYVPIFCNASDYYIQRNIFVAI